MTANLAEKVSRSLAPTEIEFLPAHLELMERPVSPTARTLMGVIAALFCVALMWSCLGQIDIVASAPGKVVATTRAKTIQSMETALVRQIHVTDGSTVLAGQPLIDFDDTQALADRAKATEALHAAKEMTDRKTLFLEAIGKADVDWEKRSTTPAARLARLDFVQYQARRHALDATLAQREKEAATTAGQLSFLSASAGISKRRAQDTEKLIAKGYVARHEYLQRELERVDAERSSVTQTAHVRELEAAVAAARSELDSFKATARQEAADQLRQANEGAAQYVQDAASIDQRLRQLHLVAPVTGTVQQLAVHTVGGVMTAGQPILTVVPKDDPLEVEATVLNQDIGFIRSGQKVTVKIETFPYTRYGFVRGTVQSISHDAVQDEKLGFVFPARIQLDSAHLDIDGVRVSLSAGMTVTAEIKTGKRRLVDYLLSPLREHVNEAGRER